MVIFRYTYVCDLTTLTFCSILGYSGHYSHHEYCRNNFSGKTNKNISDFNIHFANCGSKCQMFLLTNALVFID